MEANFNGAYCICIGIGRGTHRRMPIRICICILWKEATAAMTTLVYFYT